MSVGPGQCVEAAADRASPPPPSRWPKPPEILGAGPSRSDSVPAHAAAIDLESATVLPAEVRDEGVQ
eukprot:179872-Pyramimonas_sp.AAC.1